MDSSSNVFTLISPTLPPALAASIIIIAALFFSPGGLAWALSRKRSTIPGPTGILLALSGSAAHVSLAALARSFDAIRLMAFSVGLTRFIVSSQPETAKEILSSSAFADRPIKESAYELLFHRAMGFAPFGEYWRNLRRISSTYLFSPKRVSSFEKQRSEIGEGMVCEIKRMMERNGVVEVKRMLHFGSLNNVMLSVFGKKYDFGKAEGLELESLVKEGYELLGVFNWGDHFPLLGWLDLQGVRRRCRALAARVNVFVGKIIDEHRRKNHGVRIDEVEGGDFVDLLLGLEEKEKLSDSDMVAVLWEMIFRGTDTVAILLEWTLARMVLHPDMQAKAQAEIDSVIDSSRPVSDSDIQHLPYLQSIVKETLRMHPPGPLLSWARLAIHDVNVGDHLIPAGTTAMVNMWAITHDEAIWSEANKFNPDRFIDEDVNILGSDLRLAPFGSGRRVCPGKTMALATTHLWLAQLLKSFKWVPSENGVDLFGNLKMSLEMKNPLTPSLVMDSSSNVFTLISPTLPPALAASIIIIAALFFSPGGLAWALSRKRSTIPGPTGNLLALSGSAAHVSLAALARSFDAIRLMAFSVGLTRFIVSSQPETAKEILSSSAFADRPIKESAYELLFHRAMGFAPFGEYWRNLRRISSTYLFSPKRVSSFEKQRSEIGEGMVCEIKRMMERNGVVEVKRMLHFGSLNNVMLSVFGKKYDFGKAEGLELESLVKEGYELLGVFNWGDHFPLLGWLDLQGVRRRCRALAARVNVFVGKIIDEHRRKNHGVRIDEVEGGDFVDLLLGLEEKEKLSDSDMVAVLWEMIFRGTDTVAILLEWTLARMVLHPDMQAKAQAEIDSVIDSSRPVSDSDIQHLPYLQSIVKETLRMHPPGPLLSWARLAIHDVNVGDHLIPAGTTAMVNMWAITHDEAIWSEANKFNPDRFIDEDVNILGSDLRLAPFGSGRRVCPGKTMALATTHLWLAQLLKSFKWVPSKNGVDLSGNLKMSLEMKNPLVCVAIPRN
ncbi:hypothetical protein M5K25_002842 [Dendrobium thyrsiflorum]|uniref:Cytochrome P450 78A5 n=1 Tax=Dendrobium thyrsiflorum TaxID=117978 RepID=A0ABD0VPK7_DENTH